MKFVEAIAIFFLGMIFALYLCAKAPGIVAVNGEEDSVQTTNYKGHMYKLVPMEGEK